MKTLLPLSLIILLIAAGIAFVVFWPSNTDKIDTTIPSQTQTTQTNTPAALQGIPAIKAYAAQQFNVKEDQVNIVRSEQQQWEDVCFDLPIPNYDCTKKAISGYEVVVEIDGNQTKYRGSDDGTIIRVVKTPSPESLTGTAAEPSPTETN